MLKFFNKIKNMNNKEINVAKKDSIYIINKIKHKPLLIEYIFSYSKNRPYILFDLISTDKFLKRSLKKTFENSQRENELTKDLNKNIINYISYRKIYEKLPISINMTENDLLKENNQLNKIIKKKKYKPFFENESIKSFINNKKNFKDTKLLINLIIIFFNHNYRNIVHKILETLLIRQEKEEKEYYRWSGGWHYEKDYFGGRKYTLRNKKEVFENYLTSISLENNLFNKLIEEELNLRKEEKKFKKLIKPFDYYEYCLHPNKVFYYYLQTAEKENEVEKILEIIFMVYEDYFKFLNKSEFEFYNYPYITKKYRKSCIKKAKENMEKNGLKIFEKNKKLSIVEKILRPYLDKSDKYKLQKGDIINFCFEYFSTLDIFLLYNLPIRLGEAEEKEEVFEYLDEKYFNYLQKYNIKQMIKLICIIDRYKYCEYISNINYAYISELHFVLYTEVDELFMFNDLPISDLYKMFVTYFITIKNFENIKTISFGDEFLMNKNQFISYNDEYYQSILSYLIDQFYINNLNKKNNILEKVNLDKIIINEDNLDNIYERFKILYGFNAMFPLLKEKKILEVKYADIIENKCIKDEYSTYKIIIIDFENKILNDKLNEIKNNINNFIDKNLDTIKNKIEMVYCNNLNIKEDNININDLNIFINWPNIKEFIINNYNMPIIKNDLFQIKNNEKKDNKFNYIYLGYNINNDLIYYRNGINRITSTDILDLFNIFNNNIYKINLKYENINILYDKNQSKLEIKNLSKNIPKKKDNYYYYSLKELSDLINNKTNLSDLIIDGFDFKFDYIKNNKIKNLSINYYQEKENNKFFEYLLNLEEGDDKSKSLLEEDLNLSSKFPNLETINIGNIKNEQIFYNKLFRAYNFSNNLKQINIISFSDISLHMKNKEIKINILVLNNNKINKDKNEEDKQNIDNEYDEENEQEEEYEEEEEYENFFNDKYEDILEEENIIVTNKVKSKKRKIKTTETQEDNKILLIGKNLESYKIKEEKLYKNDIEQYLNEEKILYFKSELINSIEHYQLINQSFELINKNINQIRFKSLGYCSIFNNNKKPFISFDIKNLFIILKTEKGNIICIFLENKEKNKKGNDFYLFLNYNKVFYYKNSKKKDINEFYSNLVDKEINRKETNCFNIKLTKDILGYDLEEKFNEFTKYKNYWGGEVLNDDPNVEFIEIFKISFE